MGRWGKVACAVALAAAGCATSQGTGGAVAPGAAAAKVDAATTLKAAEDALAEGRLPVADELFRKAVAAAPGDDRAHVGYGRLLLARGRPGEAASEFERALAIRESAGARAGRGRALAVQGRLDEAAADLERAATTPPPGDPQALALLAAVQLGRGDRVAVQDAWSRLVATAGREGAASATWPALLSLPPDPVQPQESIDRCTRGYVALLDGQFSEADREGFNGMRFSPGFAWCAAMRAEARWRDGDVAGAEAGLRWAIERYPARIGPLRADAEGLLAEVLSREPSRAAEAISLARTALGVRGDRTAVLASLGRACAATGDAACARDAATRLLAQPRVPQPLREEAEAWRR